MCENFFINEERRCEKIAGVSNWKTIAVSKSTKKKKLIYKYNLI